MELKLFYVFQQQQTTTDFNPNTSASMKMSVHYKRTNIGISYCKRWLVGHKFQISSGNYVKETVMFLFVFDSNTIFFS